MLINSSKYRVMRHMFREHHVVVSAGWKPEGNCVFRFSLSRRSFSVLIHKFKWRVRVLPIISHDTFNAQDTNVQTVFCSEWQCFTYPLRSLTGNPSSFSRELLWCHLMDPSTTLSRPLIFWLGCMSRMSMKTLKGWPILLVIAAKRIGIIVMSSSNEVQCFLPFSLNTS